MTAKGKLLLKVSEARQRDVGRGIARIDPADFGKNGEPWEVGEILEIKGKKKTAVKLMPAYAEDRGQKILQVDGIIRENAQAGLDEKVGVVKCEYKPAARLILEPATVSSFRGDRDMRYIGRLIEGLPVVTGDRVRATPFGSRPMDFKVINCVPKDTVVIVQPTTRIEIKGAGKEVERSLAVSYEDVGGLGPVTRRVREMIELPLKYPQVFERLGIDAPKGVLLHGPPGCGKTLMARAVANETDAFFISISGPEIMGKYYGESEARLRSVFEQAQKNAPAIVFLDELDALAPKREELGGEKQVEKRVVAQLLAILDGLESRGQIIVIGATNIPDALDPALRRPGRFDRELVIPIPDRNGRLEILQIHTRGMPLGEDVRLEKLAEITHGFVGADLEAFAREAAMTVLREIMPEVDFELAEIPYETLLELEINMQHFMEALKEVDPSAIREVFVEVPDVWWDDVGGLEGVKQELKEAVEWPLKYPQLFEKANTRPAKGIILHGPPGTGKTLMAKAAANESRVNFISVKGPELMSKFLGESEKSIRDIFKKAKQASPTILFFDEIDAIVPIRGMGGGDSTHTTERVISQFLTEMDGVEELTGVVVLAATNRLDMIDPAILRAGRFDVIVELPLPDLEAREKILKIHTRGKPLAKNIPISKLARKTEGFSGADLEALVRQTASLAIREFLSREGEKAGEKVNRFVIKVEHFNSALEKVGERQ